MHKYQQIGCVADETEKAQAALKALGKLYDFIDLDARRKDKGQRRKPACVDAILVLGGDGFMLQMLHRYLGRGVPLYGMNCGTVGFLLNSYNKKNILERISEARESKLYPLRMFARTVDGKQHQVLAFNEVSLFRQTRQAAKIRVTVDHVVRISEMISDGILVSTPAGSTAYNFSAGGPILPLSANVIALTPLSPFRPRRWKGALLPHTTSITFEILEAQKRPVSAVADFTEIRDVVSVAVSEQTRSSVSLLFDPEHVLEERIIKEQFIY
jgi:NAD+ kinase